MRKILIFSHEWPPYLGGVGTVGFQISQWYSDNDYDVTVITREQQIIHNSFGVKIHQVKTMPYFWFLSYKKYFKKNINLKDYDEIILNECAPTISSSLIFSQSDYDKTSVIIHGLEIENIYLDRVANIGRRFFNFKSWHQKACIKSKNIVFVGNFIKDKFLKYTSLPISEKSKIIYAGVNASLFDIGERNINNSLYFNVVSASRITLMKGYKEKFNVMNSAIGKNPSIRWIICGDGDYIDKLKSMVANSSIKDNVIFKGSCSRSQLNKIYSESDLYLLLSRYDEALPLSYIEAQLSGLYTIGYNKGGVIETIREGYTGSLINSYQEACDIILRFANDKDLLPNSREIRKDALRFDMNETLKELTRL
ncbi:glycosyltransferase family 4 protein [Vibrio splendidus]